MFAFVMKADGVDFPEAVRKLSAGKPVEKAGRALESKARGRRESAAAPSALLTRVADHYQRTFRESREGQEYLKSRGLDDPEMFRAFGVGFADGSLSETIGRDGDVVSALRSSGVVTRNSREPFSGCVVFPLSLPDAGVVGLYGRHASKDQHLYLPGPRRGVFHWQALKGSDEVILTESVIDALTLCQAGIRNVSAVYGVNGFTPDHAELICVSLREQEPADSQRETIRTAKAWRLSRHLAE